MKIGDLISPSVAPLHLGDTVEHALGVLLETNVRHLPVVSADGRLVGLLTEEQLLEASGPDAPVEQLLGPLPISAQPGDHVFDVTKRIIQHDLTLLPVTSTDGHYEGTVRRYDIFEQFARMLATQEPGAILALEIAPRDYSLAKLIHTIEQSDVKVLSIASEPPTGTGATRVTIKLNTTDATRVRHMLEHHGYRILAAFGERDDEILERVQAFMRYLEV